MKRKVIFISFPIVLLFGIYFLGPEPDQPKFDPSVVQVPQTPNQLETYITNQERKHHLKPDNEARIVWADSSRRRTEYAVVYIHGFSASQEEGDPVHENFAKKFGCNLYLARMADHGIDTVEQLVNFTPDRWWTSAKEALAIGKAIGDKVILMSTSTGGTMALLLAAQYPEDVFALINLSPNIAINNPNAWISNNPWGLQIARMVVGGKYVVSKPNPVTDKYWNNSYRLEAVSQLEELLEEKMTPETFKKIKCPNLMLYYYKNEQEQDSTVKVSAMIDMFNQLGTPENRKEKVAIPNARTHKIGSGLVSKDVPAVEEACEKFAVEKLGMKKVQAQH